MAMELLRDDEIKQYIEGNKAKNTGNKTKSDLNGWYRLCDNAGKAKK